MPSICNANFKQKRNLVGHIASVHDGRKPFECSICDAKFADKSNLSKHISSLHESENLHEISKYVCTPQHVEGDSTKLVKDMKKIIVALLYIL